MVRAELRKIWMGAAAVGLVGACSSATPTGFDPVSTRGEPATMVATSSRSTLTEAGRLVEPRPAVQVRDGSGAPVPGVLVSFDPDPGSGDVSRRVVQTGRNGIAEVDWTLGPTAGTQRLRAQASGLPTVSFSVAVVPAGPRGSTEGFQIEVRFQSGEGTAAQRLAFSNARARWEKVLIGDLSDIRVTRRAGFCGPSPALDEVVDDLLILTELVAIDGRGGVLGSAGPCLIRNTSDLPILGRMRFDTADLDQLEASGTLEDVIVHEMGHVLGIGSLWDVFGLIADAHRADSTRADPHFVGGGALAAFDAIGGSTYQGSKVPIEDTGEPGTRLSHWRETTFREEMMTGYINRGQNPLSLVTVASMEDMGYVTDPSAAEAYRLFATRSSSVSASRVDAPGERFDLANDILDQPIYTIDEAGDIRPLRPR